MEMLHLYSVAHTPKPHARKVTEGWTHVRGSLWTSYLTFQSHFYGTNTTSSESVLPLVELEEPMSGIIDCGGGNNLK